MARSRWWLDIIQMRSRIVQYFGSLSFQWHLSLKLPSKEQSDVLAVITTKTSSTYLFEIAYDKQKQIFFVGASLRPVTASRKACRYARILKRRDPRSSSQTLYFWPRYFARSLSDAQYDKYGDLIVMGRWDFSGPRRASIGIAFAACIAPLM